MLPSVRGSFGGQQQRVAIARTLALKPDIILLTNLCSLDVTNQVGTQNGNKESSREFGTTMIYVTHDQEEAFRCPI